MADAICVVGLGGSIAATSRSRAALVTALRASEEAGAETTLFDLRELDLPMFNPEMLPNPPPSAIRLAEAAYGAAGLIWSSPMYHGTISGALKNALDWLYLIGDRDPPNLADKVIGLISTAGGTQGLQAANTMEFAVRALRAWAVPLVVPIGPASQLFDAQGQLQDQQARRQLIALGTEVVRVARRFVAGQIADAAAECAAATHRVAAAA